MARSTNTTSAVPRAALAPDESVLAFEPLGWNHLAAYLDKADRLPADGALDSPELASAFASVRSAVRAFGTPAQVAAQPGALTGASRPKQAYLAFAWTVARLQAAATDTLGAIQSCLASGASAASRREALQGLGALSAACRDQAATLLPEVQQFRTAILRANQQFNTAMEGIGRTLQEEWEAVGAQRARLESLQTKLQHTGVLHPHKRHELLAQIKNTEEDLEAATTRAEQLRIQAAALQEIIQAGAWLDASLGAMADFLQDLRAAWASFGGAMTQLGADATPDQLADDTWLGTQLDTVEALPRWQALAAAAEGFRARAEVPQPTTTSKKAQP
jgi:hypothetical protein